MNFYFKFQASRVVLFAYSTGGSGVFTTTGHRIAEIALWGWTVLWLLFNPERAVENLIASTHLIGIFLVSFSFYCRQLFLLYPLPPTVNRCIPCPIAIDYIPCKLSSVVVSLASHPDSLYPLPVCVYSKKVVANFVHD